MVSEAHKITCPYCVIGYALVTLQRNGTGVEFNMRDYPKCVCCSRYFKIKPTLKLSGERLMTDALPKATRILGAENGC